MAKGTCSNCKRDDLCLVAKGLCGKCYNELYPPETRQKRPRISSQAIDMKKWPTVEYVKIYHTSDGNEFTNETEALKHQLEIYTHRLSKRKES